MPPVLSRNKQNTPRQARLSVLPTRLILYSFATSVVYSSGGPCVASGFWSRMNTPSFGKFSPRWLAGKRGLIVTLLAGLAILALGRGMNLPAREVYRERQIRQLEEDAQWVAERLERRMNIPAPQREATWPLAAMRAALQTLAQERHYQLLLVNGDGHLLAASHALPASVLAQVQAQFPREMQPPLFGSHYQTIQPFAPHQRMLSRALNGNAGLAGWNLVMLAPDGGLPSLLVAYRWPVTIGLGAVLASALLALRQAARARRKR